jgi:YidC/Oxa1 family membrane protein insertase
MCGACTFQWLIDVLVWLLTLFHAVTRDWGLAIIALVFLVRALLHPITKKSQVYMMRMQKMAPELEKLKKKYGDNKEELARAQMQFYKEQGMTPILGCLPMFLQMPIWIALWSSLQSTFELRHAPFLWGFTWIHDLAKPDRLINFSPVHIPLPFCGVVTLDAVNLLPLLLAIVFYLQTKYFTPKPPSMTPEQEQQQKIMTWMTTLMFPVMLYKGPSGLNLYITASTLFGIIESKIIRDHIKQREALEAARGPTIVDAPPPGKAKTDDPARKKGWFERLQEMADQARKEAKRKGGGGGGKR